MRPHLLVLGVVGLCACEPPPISLSSSAERHVSFEGDTRLPPGPPSSGIGTQRHAITVGDGPSGEQILYINYDGATIKRASGSQLTDDARLNESWVIDTVAVGASVTIPAFNAAPLAEAFGNSAQAVKDAITNQVIDWYDPHNIQVVTTRPTSGRYQMVVVGGTPSLVMSNPGSAVGVAPIDCFNESQVNIGFAFSAKLTSPAPTTNPERQIVALLIAQTIAHEAAHSFGLEHVATANDVMTTSVDQNVSGFLNATGNLVEPPSDCIPSATTANSNQRLVDNLGPAPSGPVVPKPTVQFLSPLNGSTVPRQFTIAVSADAASGGTITKIEVKSSGITILSDVTPPYRDMVMTNTDGEYFFTAIAYNSLGGKASVQTQFNVVNGAPEPVLGCVLETDCFLDENCVGGKCETIVTEPMCDPACGPDEICQADGTCLPNPDVDMSQPPEVPNVGAACTDSSQCTGGATCATAGSRQYCTAICDPAAPTLVCPAGYKCTAVGAEHYCGPDSGGCAMAPASSSSPLGALVLLLLAGPLALRRRRSVAT